MAYTPQLGGALNAPFPAQFADSVVSTISLATTLIEQLSNDGTETTVAHGTGFFWRHKSDVYLFSARHVFAGRNPFDDTLLSSVGFLPADLVVYPTIEGPPQQFSRRRMIVRVVIDEAPQWIEDKEFPTLRTDIAAINLGQLPNTRCLNDEDELFQNILTLVGMECAIVGYPTSLFRHLMTPVWRVGTIASEPLLPVDEKPMFLLDAATSPGFSGGPVFRRHVGPAPVRMSDGSIAIIEDRVLTTTFVGVYAGRLLHSYIGGEIPFVFYANRIPFILPP